MDISEEDFFLQAGKANISKEKANVLWKALQTTRSSSQETIPFKLLYCLGSLTVISAMVLFMGLNWDFLGGGGIFLTASLYSILLGGSGRALWKNKTLQTPAGLLFTLAICMIPLAIYGLEVYLQIWPDSYPDEYANFYSRLRGSRIFMEVGTLLAGLVALRFFHSPFITIPIFLAGWFFALDFVRLFQEDADFLTHWVSFFYGLGLIAAGHFLDRGGKENYAFWSYFFGTLAFWFNLSYLMWWGRPENEGTLLLYLLVNLGLLFLSILVQRKILLMAGALGIFLYLSHLAYRIFENSSWFPVILGLIGILILYCGILYQKYRLKFQNWIFSYFPERIKSYFSFNP
ncbi:hypothetical protein [Parachlamydia sp. AcF125]|uniref:hypothetical protein n=1 Tax=Parachlamydia sp. AcF125 TaxID=2795736 RepID=UPI001BC98186|nr:hypothetical protein [Parachlamydia sp. AcF125]MBS4168012.1 hypothetical protein [Parachlamydia sp. AcF125]